jgi:molybdate transport system substrate-binding protein
VIFALVPLLAAAALALPAPARAQPDLRIAAAADLQTAMPDLALAFKREHGVTVSASFGSSGNFFAQIRNGAPFDVFLSADVEYPRRLIADRQADPASLVEYATGRIVLWARKEDGVDLGKGLDVLRDPRVRKVAIANPDHAPYGRAAISALKTAGLHDAVQSKLVLGENISQTAQLVESGNADVGIIALSLALGPTLSARGTYIEISSASHPPISQAAIVISKSRRMEAARAFVRFLTGRSARQILQRFGFAVPPVLRPVNPQPRRAERGAPAR